MRAPRNPKMNRKPYDRRGDTPEARKIRSEREMRRFYCSCGTTPRHHYAHWLNVLIEDRQQARQPREAQRQHKSRTQLTRPYPAGKELGQVYINNAQASHRRSTPYIF